MIGMSLLSFLLLPGIGLIVPVVLHFPFCCRFLEGSHAVFAKMAMGGMSAWLGSPLLTTGRGNFGASVPPRRSY